MTGENMVSGSSRKILLLSKDFIGGFRDIVAVAQKTLEPFQRDIAAHGDKLKVHHLPILSSPVLKNGADGYADLTQIGQYGAWYCGRCSAIYRLLIQYGRRQRHAAALWSDIPLIRLSTRTQRGFHPALPALVVINQMPERETLIIAGSQHIRKVSGVGGQSADFD